MPNWKKKRKEKVGSMNIIGWWYVTKKTWFLIFKIQVCSMTFSYATQLYSNKSHVLLIIIIIIIIIINNYLILNLWIAKKFTVAFDKTIFNVSQISKKIANWYHSISW